VADEAMNGAVVEVPGDDAAAAFLIIHDQVDGEELGVELQALLVQGMQDRMMPGTVSTSTVRIISSALPNWPIHAW
jgi:hypothetical protein